jgi:2,3-bisphosphoglycerate-independent phosphoglycerate mutase
LKAACVAGAGLYKGIGRLYSMKIIEVKGATGLPDTNIKAKFKATKKALKNFDFIFVHVKAADSLGEDGNAEGKKKFIEKTDKAFKELMNLKDTLLVVTADHSTPCELKHHSKDAVPVLFHGPGVKADATKQFGEKAALKGSLGRFAGKELMIKIKRRLGVI